MKKIFLLAGVAMLLSWSMSAEEITGGTVDGADKVTAEKEAAKLIWFTNLEKAKEAARKRKVGIMVYFSGTDWCPACKIFDKYVLSSPDFINYAKDNLVLLNIDFPRDSSKVSQATKEYNTKLGKTFGVVAFPSIFLLKSNGESATAEIGYRGESGARYVAKIKAILAKAEQSVKSEEIK